MVLAGAVAPARRTPRKAPLRIEVMPVRMVASTSSGSMPKKMFVSLEHNENDSGCVGRQAEWEDVFRVCKHQKTRSVSKTYT